MPDDAVHLLRILEPHQPGLGQRVDRDDLRAVGLGLLQHRQHAGVVGARVLPGDEDDVGLFEVLHGHRALADADRVGQRRARGLVAHVRAVRQVVGAEAAHQQLIDERGFVAGAPGGVEDRLVGALERVEVLRDDVMGVIPADRPVVVIALAQDHRVGQPALLAQPVLGALAQIGEGVPREEVRGDDALGRLLGDRLRAVLAELGELAAAVLLGPRAAGAVETLALVEPNQGGRGAQRTHRRDAALQRHHDGLHPGRLVLGAGAHCRVLVVGDCDVLGDVATRHPAPNTHVPTMPSTRRPESAAPPQWRWAQRAFVDSQRGSLGARNDETDRQPADFHAATRRTESAQWQAFGYSERLKRKNCAGPSGRRRSG